MRLAQLVGVVNRNVVLDSGWNIEQALTQFAGLSGNDLQFRTIPTGRPDLRTPFDGVAIQIDQAAVRSFARTWLVELKERRIRVNILSPGTIDTPILDPLGPDAKEFFKSQIPRGEMGRPEEIATVALFLASSDSSFVNGIELFVDGGMIQV